MHVIIFINVDLSGVFCYAMVYMENVKTVVFREVI